MTVSSARFVQSYILFSWTNVFCVYILQNLRFSSFRSLHSLSANANRDCRSSMEFLILLIWPLMYSCCSFFIGVSSLRTFLSFCTLTFVEFLLLSKDVFFYIVSFSLTAIDTHRTLHLDLGLIGMQLTAASIWAVTKFLYSSFGVCDSDVS